MDVPDADADEEQNHSQFDHDGDSGHLGCVLDAFHQPEVEADDDQHGRQIHTGQMPDDADGTVGTEAEKRQGEQTLMCRAA